VWVSKGGAFTGEISAEMLVDAHVSTRRRRPLLLSCLPAWLASHSAPDSLQHCVCPTALPG
jgi:hypothetical protein